MNWGNAQNPTIDANAPINIFEEADSNINPPNSFANFQIGNEKTKSTIRDKTSILGNVSADEASLFTLAESPSQNQEQRLSFQEGLMDNSLISIEGSWANIPRVNIGKIQSIEDKVDIILLSPIIKKEKPEMLPKDYITLSRGITNWDKNYGSVLPERQQNEQTLLSYLSPLSYTHKFSNNFTVMAGLRHQKMKTRLDWNTYLVNYAVIALKDTILTINTNSITGHQSQIRGDVEISVNATRQVCRFNQYQLYQIPLTVGKSWEMTKKWFTELSLGSAVNIYSNNKGRNIFEGDIQDFSHSVTPFLDNRWGFQARGMVKISYRINEHYGLLIDASLQKKVRQIGARKKMYK